MRRNITGLAPWGREKRAFHALQESSVIVLRVAQRHFHVMGIAHTPTLKHRSAGSGAIFASLTDPDVLSKACRPILANGTIFATLFYLLQSELASALQLELSPRINLASSSSPFESCTTASTGSILPPVARQNIFKHHSPSRSAFRALHRGLVFRPHGFLQPFFYITLYGFQCFKTGFGETLPVLPTPNAQADRIRVSTLSTVQSSRVHLPVV
jgi:hypothetical protein